MNFYPAITSSSDGGSIVPSDRGLAKSISIDSKLVAFYEIEFGKPEARLEFVESIHRALDKIETCFDRMKSHLQKNDLAIDLIDTRLSQLKKIESQAKKERDVALKGGSISLDETREFDEILIAINQEISDAEDQESVLKVGSNLLHLDSEAIDRLQAEAREKISNALLSYENNYVTLLNSVNDDLMSATLRNKDLKNKLQNVLRDKQILEEQVHSSENDLESFEKNFPQYFALETEMLKVLQMNKLLSKHLKEKTKSAKEYIGLLNIEKKKNSRMKLKLRAVLRDNKSLTDQILDSKAEIDFLLKIKDQYNVAEIKELDENKMLREQVKSIRNDLGESARNNIQNAIIEHKLLDVLNDNKMLIEQIKTSKGLTLAEKRKAKIMSLEKKLKCFLENNKMLKQHNKSLIEEVEISLCKSTGNDELQELCDVISDNKKLRGQITALREYIQLSERVNTKQSQKGHEFLKKLMIETNKISDINIFPGEFILKNQTNECYTNAKKAVSINDRDSGYDNQQAFSVERREENIEKDDNLNAAVE